jgi:hypothetical protein
VATVELENMDGMWADDLDRYAAELSAQTGPVAVLGAQYARLKADAMRARLAGNTQLALDLEARCDRVYGRLPREARW